MFSSSELIATEFAEFGCLVSFHSRDTSLKGLFIALFAPWRVIALKLEILTI
jgi:hypothetical protein